MALSLLPDPPGSPRIVSSPQKIHCTRESLPGTPPLGRNIQTNFLLLLFGIFFYFIDSAITGVPISSPLAHLHPAPPLPQAIPTPLFMSIGHA